MSRPTPSATDRDAGLGVRFAEAVVAQDPAALRAVFADSVDFGALTPRRCWEAADPAGVEQIVLGTWFGPGTSVHRVLRLDSGGVADRRQVTYRLLAVQPDGPKVIEQTAYFEDRDGHITWMRLLCSGFRPAQHLAREGSAPLAG